MQAKIFKHLGKIYISLAKGTLLSLYRTYAEEKMTEAINEMGFSEKDLIQSKSKQDRIAQKVSEDILRRKEHREVFGALYVFADFNQADIEICFELKDSFNPKKDKVTNLEELIKACAESTLTDFAYRHKKDIRHFQLKQYRGPLTPDALSNFIKSNLKKYGGNMGDVNLLVILQSTDKFMSINFQEVHESLLQATNESGGEIIVSYNDLVDGQRMITVYPKLAEAIKPPSQ